MQWEDEAVCVGPGTKWTRKRGLCRFTQVLSIHKTLNAIFYTEIFFVYTLYNVRLVLGPGNRDRARERESARVREREKRQKTDRRE